MPQTVALQRGTTTVSSNGSNSVTLFTQSTGTATRVIKSQLGVYFSTTPNTSAVYMTVIHNVSGGQSFIIGYLYGGANRYPSYQFPPGASSDNPWKYVPRGTAAISPGLPAIASNASGGTGSASASGLILTNSDNSNTIWNLLPDNFYIGPSDSISMKINGFILSGKNAVPTTANITYSFVTITES